MIDPSDHTIKAACSDGHLFGALRCECGATDELVYQLTIVERREGIEMHDLELHCSACDQRRALSDQRLCEACEARAHTLWAQVIELKRVETEAHEHGRPPATPGAMPPLMPAATGFRELFTELPPSPCSDRHVFVFGAQRCLCGAARMTSPEVTIGLPPPDGFDRDK